MENIQEVIQEKIRERSAKVAILGLGYVGLPLAVILAEAGFDVTGVEPDRRKVEDLDRGESYVQDVPTDQVANLIQTGKKLVCLKLIILFQMVLLKKN